MTQLRADCGIPVRPKSVIQDGRKLCMTCGEMKLLSEYSTSVRGLGGLQANCKPCFADRYRPSREIARTRTASYRARHPERWAALHRLTQFRRRMAKSATSDGTVTDDFLKALYATEGCAYCGQATPRDQRTAEHMRPLSRGGSHAASNLVMACFTCNSAKGGRTVEEYLETMR